MYAGIATRTVHALSMDKSPTGEEDIVFSEHRKRLFWTTTIMDCWTSSALGLRPFVRLDEVEVDLPCHLDTDMDSAGEFGMAAVFAMHVKLCQCQMRTFTRRAQTDSQQGWEEFCVCTRKALRYLEQWRAEVPASFALEPLRAFSREALARPEMRSLASIHLRYGHVGCIEALQSLPANHHWQAIISVLRPVFFKLMTKVTGGNADVTVIDGYQQLGSECFAAARCNLQILQALSEAGRIGESSETH